MKRNLVSDRNSPEVNRDREWFDKLCSDLKSGYHEHQPDDLSGVTYNTKYAAEFIGAAEAHSSEIHLDGTILEGLELPIMVHKKLTVNASVHGDLTVGHRVAGGLTLNGPILGDLTLTKESRIEGNLELLEGCSTGNVYLLGDVTEDMIVAGQIDDDLKVAGKIVGSLKVLNRGLENLPAPKPNISGKLLLTETSTVGSLLVSGEIEGVIDISGSVEESFSLIHSIVNDVIELGRVGADVLLSETSVIESVSISGEIQAGLKIAGKVEKQVFVSGTINENLGVSGTIAGVLGVSQGGSIKTLGIFENGSVDRLIIDEGGAVDYIDVERSGSVGDLTVNGGVKEIFFNGLADRRITLSPTGLQPTTLMSISGARFDREVLIGDNVSIASCDFRQCSYMDKLHLIGGDLFPKGKREITRTPAGHKFVKSSEIPHREMGSIYRQLRSNFEGRNDRPGAAIFYRGEMNMRRIAAQKSLRWDRGLLRRLIEITLLWIYRLVSGYGLIASLALAWFVILSFGSTWIFIYDGLDLDTSEAVLRAGLWDGWAFTVQSMVGFFRPPQAELSPFDQWLQIGLRFLGPLLITQVVLAIREHVAR